jgi:hypothetical protein
MEHNTSKPRTSAGDHSFMDKLYRPVVSYAKNVAKQSSDAFKAELHSFGASSDARSYPPSRQAEMNAKANAASANANKQIGQAIGAITQNRKYKD